MRYTIASLGTICALLAIVLLVDFLGAPVQGEPMESGLRYVSLELSVAHAAEIQPDHANSQAVGQGQLKGQVIDSRGNGLAGVPVSLSGPAPIPRPRLAFISGPTTTFAETITGPDGSFSFEELKPANVRIWAGDEDWLFNLTHPVEVKAGKCCSQLLLTLQPRPETARLKLPE